jgi:nucleoside-diphosphate-sugar epimerase
VRRFEEMQGLFDRFRDSGPALTTIMPPNICGPGKIPLEGMGGRSLAVHKAHARGEPVPLPDGPEALVGPCDAEDIAHCFALAIKNRDASRGQMFNVGSAYALTASEFIGALAEIHGARIPIERVSWEKYTTRISPDRGAYAHFEFHMCPDISKARRLLGYEPKYTPEETLERAVKWMREEGMM